MRRLGKVLLAAIVAIALLLPMASVASAAPGDGGFRATLTSAPGDGGFGR